MRKNEVAKIRLEKDFGFGARDEEKKLRFPVGYEEEGSEKQAKLKTEDIVYEVKLHSWVDRDDIEYNGSLMKTFTNKPSRKDWDHPYSKDELTLNCKIYQGDTVFLEKQNWELTIKDEEEI